MVESIDGKAIPELIEEVNSGHVSISAAAMAAALPEGEQQENHRNTTSTKKPDESRLYFDCLCNGNKLPKR